jgi:hypothetical protein
VFSDTIMSELGTNSGAPLEPFRSDWRGGFGAGLCVSRGEALTTCETAKWACGLAGLGVHGVDESKARIRSSVSTRAVGTTSSISWFYLDAHARTTHEMLPTTYECYYVGS